MISCCLPIPGLRMPSVTLEDLPSAKQLTGKESVETNGTASLSYEKRSVKNASCEAKTSLEAKDSITESSKYSTHCSVNSFTTKHYCKQDSANQRERHYSRTSRPETSQSASFTRQEPQVERMAFKSEHLSSKIPSSQPSNPKLVLQPFSDSPSSSQSPSTLGTSTATTLSKKHAPVSRSHTTFNSKPENFADRCRQLKAEECGGGPQSHAPVGRTYSGPITQREVREAVEESQPLPDHMEDTISIMFHQYNGAMKDYKDIVSDALGTGKVTKRELTFQRFCELIDDEKVEEQERCEVKVSRWFV